MTKIERIQKNIQANKELLNDIESIGHYTIESFISDAQRYLKASIEGRLIASQIFYKSGNSDLKYLSIEKAKKGYYKKYYTSNYNCLFLALGYNKSKNNEFYFKFPYMNMDVNFEIHYRNIIKFQKLGFISKNICETLKESTPKAV